MAKKRKKLNLTPELQAHFAETMRMLEERVVFHAKRAADKRRGQQA